MPMPTLVSKNKQADAKDGFRLGLFEDFGIPFEGQDADVDDVVHNIPKVEF